ncbi:MAG: RluA family pseudouridine synthase [Parachlamydiaceae bacterium]|nr:RluA family pseudouridine synthase [Parachlamydiaceae bacterium]
MKWRVTPTESGSTLLAFLKSKLPEKFSARRLKRALEDNLCQINGRTERFASFTVGNGDQITLLVDELPSPTSKSELFSPERILYEDDSLLIYNKPVGVVSDSTELLKAIQRNLPYLALVHRLDRDTTGVLIFAKTTEMLHAMNALFKERTIQKSYLAIVDGYPEKPSGIIDNQLGILKRYQGQTIWGVVNAKGLPATTEWQCQKKGHHASLLNCFPKTGRTHQLRVHLSHMGHPILGDHQYGRLFRCSYRPNRYLLHAESVSFLHPLTQAPILVTAPIPLDFQQACDQLFGVSR